MRRRLCRRLLTFVVALAAVWIKTPAAQEPTVPTARLTSAPLLVLPGAIDSNTPLVWALDEGVPRLFALTSWGGTPTLAEGADLARLTRGDPVTIEPHPGDGIWMEAIVQDAAGAWYGYYHHERPADACGRHDRFIPRVGAARSEDHGRSWRDLGIIVEAAPDTFACSSSNRFVLGGVGDVSVMLDADSQNLYLFFTQYPREASAQGVAIARLAWADRDEPAGRVSVWNDGAWLPAVERRLDDEGDAAYEYPLGTPLVAPTQPWHDRDASANAYWGPSVHWNTHLEQYVMLLNRARDEQFIEEGVYVSFSPSLDDPRRWSAPVKILNGGGWYTQVVGLESDGTDRLAGRRARFFNTGRSEHFVEFQRPSGSDR